ncbi:MAG: hypothetical protein ACRDGS_04100 [Chloroflexota bacterium]
MSKHVSSDFHHDVYKTYDDRAISWRVIEDSVHRIEIRQRRQIRLRRLGVLLLSALMVVAILLITWYVLRTLSGSKIDPGRMAANLGSLIGRGISAATDHF